MYDKIKKGKIEFENENYDKAISYFDEVENDDEYYQLAQLYKSGSLMELKEYEEALSILDMLIHTNPYEDILWVDKIRCHIYLHEDEKARKALKEMDRLVDRNNKSRLLTISKLYSILRDHENVIKYCDYALANDPDYKEALFEKAMALKQLKKFDELDNVSKKILEISDKDLLSLMPLFIIMIFSKKYRDALDILNNVEDDEHDEYISMFKAGIYSRICDDYSINLLLVTPVKLSIDEILEIMLDFVEDGKDSGEIKGVQYFIS